MPDRLDAADGNIRSEYVHLLLETVRKVFLFVAKKNNFLKS